MFELHIWKGNKLENQFAHCKKKTIIKERKT